MIYAVFGSAALIIFGVVYLSVRQFAKANEKVGELTVQKQSDDAVIAAVQQQREVEDDVAKMSADARRAELAKWMRR